MSDNMLLIANWFSGFGNSLLIFIAVILVVLVGVVCYLVYTEKKNKT